MAKEFSAGDVGWFLDLCESIHVDAWLDGGWGVDALLGGQSRPHADLDIMVLWKHLDALDSALRNSGFSDVHTDDHSPWNFVLGDADDRLIDFHVFEFDGDRVLYGRKEKPVVLRTCDYSGTGSIGGRTVKCTTPEFQVSSHSGYALKDKDFADVSALCEKFGIQLPAEYANWKNGSR
jgi:lincosamide nucleotidyltransferase A/C/D/E